MNIAYLVNQYPKVSHSFIRREIDGIEACGITVFRFSIRSCKSELVDEADKAELGKTRVVLDTGVLGLLTGFLRVSAERPIAVLRTLTTTLKISRHSERGLLRHLIYMLEACVLLNWFSELGVEHVHAHFGTNSTTVAMLCHTLGGPSYSFTVHGPEEFDKANTIALTEKINRAAFVVAISSFGRSQLFRWCDFEHWSKIHVIHCGVDDVFLNNPVASIPDTSQLVCIGRLCEQKGQLLLLDAVAQLAAKEMEFKLILVGDGPLRPQLEALIVSHGLQNYVEIKGWASSSEVCNHILASRAMVLPSFAEGLPVVLMESLALHRPVITTYVAGIPELVETERCGWLVPAGSIEDLVTAICAALHSSLETLEEMGNLGAERVAQHHNAAIEASKLAILFKLSTTRKQESKVDSPLSMSYTNI